ncbi:MAG: fumarate hydratase C-terminal domain-containing protein [Candidatus Omnitrophica bacterium]|nr:fumarate hydratase C-terminal domain-containing protein [Candidatus Omnitrophota bacterium]
MKEIQSFLIPDQIEHIKSLKAGDEVLLNGVMYTARDVAHKRMVETIKKKGSLPLTLSNSVIYYCGPTPAMGDSVIGSCGPTTASRMDEFTPALLNKGLRVMIGKGFRSEAVIRSIRRQKAVYFVTYGGCGAYLNLKVKANHLVAYPDLGPEAIYRLEVENFPVIVAIDAQGRVFC